MREHSGLLTDLYELTMAAGYVQTHFQARASFELFARNLPPRRNYLVAAGLEQALEYLENVNFTAQEVDYLRKHPAFHNVRDEFFNFLSTFRFSGDAWAIPEGSLVFAGEPILRISAPIVEGQIIETNLLATINFQTMVASKAARVVSSAPGHRIVEFGARRAHGTEASLMAARAATIGGCVGSSNALAGQRFGMPTYGTQAHSWVMAHEDEAEAFSQFLDVFPQFSVLLLDTYDVRAALKTILRMNRKPMGVRLDSGDLVRDSIWVRKQLDRAGWNDVKIFASGDLDEDKISTLLRSGAQIDDFGVGGAVVTPADAPTLNMIYKLVEVERGGKIREAAKLSKAKVTYPGKKQVYRLSKSSGEFKNDVIALIDEVSPGGEPMLQEVMRAGKRLTRPESIAEARARCLRSLERLPARYRQLGRTVHYPVRTSKRLEALLETVRRRVRRTNSHGNK